MTKTSKNFVFKCQYDEEKLTRFFSFRDERGYDECGKICSKTSQNNPSEFRCTISKL